MIKSQGVGYMV